MDVDTFLLITAAAVVVVDDVVICKIGTYCQKPLSSCVLMAFSGRVALILELWLSLWLWDCYTSTHIQAVKSSQEQEPWIPEGREDEMYAWVSEWMNTCWLGVKKTYKESERHSFLAFSFLWVCHNGGGLFEDVKNVTTNINSNNDNDSDQK